MKSEFAHRLVMVEIRKLFFVATLLAASALFAELPSHSTAMIFGTVTIENKADFEVFKSHEICVKNLDSGEFFAIPLHEAGQKDGDSERWIFEIEVPAGHYKFFGFGYSNSAEHWSNQSSHPFDKRVDLQAGDVVYLGSVTVQYLKQEKAKGFFKKMLYRPPFVVDWKVEDRFEEDVAMFNQTGFSFPESGESYPLLADIDFASHDFTKTFCVHRKDFVPSGGNPVWSKTEDELTWQDRIIYKNYHDQYDNQFGDGVARYQNFMSMMKHYKADNGASVEP